LASGAIAGYDRESVCQRLSAVGGLGGEKKRHDGIIQVKYTIQLHNADKKVNINND
jgi:hypothetical protein